VSRLYLVLLPIVHDPLWILRDPDMWAKLGKVLPSFLICLDGFPAFVSTQAVFG